MSNQAPWNCPPGKFVTKIREVKVKKDRIELSTTILEGPCAGQEVKTHVPVYPNPKKKRKKRWHP